MTLVIGDSIVKAFPGHVAEEVTCMSFSGYKIHELLPHAVRVAPFFVKMILHVGTNDVPSRHPVDMLVAHYKELVTAILQENPNIELVVSAVLPRFTNWWKEYDQANFLRSINIKANRLNEGLHLLCKHMEITFIDHWDDFHSPSTMNRSGLHLSKEGCFLLLENLHLALLKPSARSVVAQPVATPQPQQPASCVITSSTSPSSSDNSIAVVARSSPPRTSRTYAAVARSSVSRTIVTVARPSSTRTSKTIPTATNDVPSDHISITCLPKPPSCNAEWVTVHHRRQTVRSRTSKPSVLAKEQFPPLGQRRVLRPHEGNEEAIHPRHKSKRVNTSVHAADADMKKKKTPHSMKSNGMLQEQFPPLGQHRVSRHPPEGTEKVMHPRPQSKRVKTSVPAVGADMKKTTLHSVDSNRILQDQSLRQEDFQVTPSLKELKKRRHQRWQKKVQEEPKAVKKMYHIDQDTAQGVQPIRHSNVMHASKVLMHGNGGGPVANTYPRTCAACDNIYQTRQSFSRHLKTCGQSSNVSKTVCIFPSCTLKFYHRIAMVKHLKDDHDYEIKTENLKFVDMGAFQKWKENEELSQFSSFTKSTNKTCNDTEHHYFTCQFDAQNKTHRQSNEHYRLTSQKWSKGQIPSLCCPARMLVTVCAEGVNVEYISSHNHALTFENTKYQQIPESTRSFIKGTLAMGVSTEIVKNVLQSNAGLRGNRDGQVFPLKEHYVTSTYLNKVKTTMKGQGRIADDATSVSARVHAMLKEKDNPIIVYKSQGMDTVVGNKGLDNLPHSHDLFALGIQTQAQFAMMEKGCEKVLCLDATHSTTHYDFYLINLIVPDEYGVGYPVAHFITNKQDSDTLSLLLDSIKSRSSKQLNINVLMTDDDNSGWNAVQQVFGNDIKHLLCLWHVHRTWQRQTRAFIRDTNVQSRVYASIVTLMEERDVHIFKKMTHNFISTFKAVCPEFVNYFEKNYLNRPEVWAKCYRNFPHGSTDTNMYCESFHNKLKTKYLKRKQNKRVDVLLELLLEMERDRFLEHDYKKKTNALTSEVPVTHHKRHEAGLKIPDGDVRQFNPNIWQVMSQNKICNSALNLIYSVEKIGDACNSDFCFQKCLELSCLGLCSHNYHCSCPDISGLCKHIHKVHSLGMRNVVRDTTTSPSNEVPDSESLVMFNTPNVNHETTSENNNQSVEECLQYLEELKSFVNKPNLHRLMMRNLKTTLKDLVTQCRGVSDTSFEQPSELTPTKHVNNNQNVKPQICTTPKLHRTSLKRKAPCSPFTRPSLEERKKVKICLLNSDSNNTHEVPHEPKPPRKILHVVHPVNATIEGDTNKSLPHPGLIRAVTNTSVESNNQLSFRIFDSCGSNRTYERFKPFTPPITNTAELSSTVLKVSPEINISLLHLKSLEPRVSASDLDILMQADTSFHTGWLYDTIINAYIHKSCQHTSSALYCTTTASLSILNNMNNERLWKTNTLLTQDFIFVPCNVQSHWVLFVCRPKIRVIEFYDPLYMVCRPIYFPFLNNLKSLLNRKLNLAPCNEWKVSCPPHAMQSDKMSCGVFVCFYVKCLLTGKDCTEVVNVISYRREIYNTLTEH